MPTIDVNLGAVLVCAVANMVIGMLWYSPSTGLGRAWMKEMGLTDERITQASKEGGMGKSYFLAFVGALVMAYVFAHFLGYAQADEMSEGFQGAFWAWLGFIATVGLSMVLWEGKSWKLYTISMGYYLVTLLVMSAILVSWM